MQTEAEDAPAKEPKHRSTRCSFFISSTKYQEGMKKEPPSCRRADTLIQITSPLIPAAAGRCSNQEGAEASGSDSQFPTEDAVEAFWRGENQRNKEATSGKRDAGSERGATLVGGVSGTL